MYCIKCKFVVVVVALGVGILLQGPVSRSTRLSYFCCSVWQVHFLLALFSPGVPSTLSDLPIPWKPFSLPVSFHTSSKPIISTTRLPDQNPTVHSAHLACGNCNVLLHYVIASKMIIKPDRSEVSCQYTLVCVRTRTRRNAPW